MEGLHSWPEGRSGSREEGASREISISADRWREFAYRKFEGSPPGEPVQSGRGSAATFSIRAGAIRSATVSTGQRTAGTGRTYRGASIDGAGDGESHLAASLRARNRGHAEQLRPHGR